MYEKIPVTHTHVPARETERELTRGAPAPPPRARRGGSCAAGAVLLLGRSQGAAPGRPGARGALLRTSAKRGHDQNI